jgi:hypothetical protein
VSHVFLRLVEFFFDDLVSGFQNLHLVSCPDPRNYPSNQPGMIQMPPGGQLITRDSTQPMAAGHYLLYGYGKTSSVTLNT